MLKIPQTKYTEIEPNELSNCISHLMVSVEGQKYAKDLTGEDALIMINLIDHVCGSYIVYMLNCLSYYSS